MHAISVRLARLTLIALCAACASKAPATATGPKPDGETITRSQVEERNFRTALEIVQSLRANWLRTRGVDSFFSPTPIWVYLDNSKLGGVDALRWITPRSVAYMRRYDGLAATARWGLGHGQGVIFIATHSDMGPREDGGTAVVRENPPPATDSSTAPKSNVVQ